MEKVRPNGVIINGKPDTVRLQEIVEIYDVWSKPGFVDIPQDRWMRTPLVDGWQSKLRRHQGYRLGNADREVIDDTYD